MNLENLKMYDVVFLQFICVAYYKSYSIVYLFYRRSLMLSARTQKNLSGYGDVGVGLPPASPSEFEPSREVQNIHITHIRLKLILYNF